MTIPNSDGTIERINYGGIETGVNDEMQFSFIVGRNNTDKTIKRSINGIPTTDYNYDYHEIHNKKLRRPENLQAVSEGDAVRLRWINDNHPNFGWTSLVRKVTGFSTEPNDGDLISFTVNEEVFDNTAQPNTIYYYSAYSLDTLGNWTEPSHVLADTSLFSLYGYIQLTSGEALEGVQITLTDQDENILQVVYSGADGRYFFGNLRNGNYYIEASHPSLTIQDNIRTISVVDQNIQEDFIANTIPSIMLLFDVPEVHIGDQAFLQWAFRNINTNNTINITINKGSSWETIGSNIPILNGEYWWTIDGDESENALLKITLNSDPSVYDEHTLSIQRSICIGDYEPDGDVDGLDLYHLIVGDLSVSMDSFTNCFGRSDCPINTP